MKRFSAVWLAGLGIMSAFFVSSCGSDPVREVSALVLESGDAAGLVIKYTSALDESSVSADKYSVPGEVIGKVFTSELNPFEHSDSESPASKDGDHYVIVLLKEKGASGNEVQSSGTDTDSDTVSLPGLEIRQTGEIKTKDGKTVRSWKEALKPAMGYRIPGGRIR